MKQAIKSVWTPIEKALYSTYFHLKALKERQAALPSFRGDGGKKRSSIALT